MVGVVGRELSVDFDFGLARVRTVFGDDLLVDRFVDVFDFAGVDVLREPEVSFCIKRLKKYPSLRRGLLNAHQKRFGVFSVKKPAVTDQIESGIPDASSNMTHTPSKLWTPA